MYVSQVVCIIIDNGLVASGVPGIVEWDHHPPQRRFLPRLPHQLRQCKVESHIKGKLYL